MYERLPFPFPKDTFPRELGAVVQRTVLDGREPAREVVHTSDGLWLVSDGVSDPNEPDGALATHRLGVAPMEMKPSPNARPITLDQESPAPPSMCRSRPAPARRDTAWHGHPT